MRLTRLFPYRLFPYLLLILALPAYAQTTLVDIPPGPNTAAVDDPLNEDVANFTVSTFDDTLDGEFGRLFYFSAQNNRILLNLQRPNGSWKYPVSRVAVEIPEGPNREKDNTIALGVVLVNPTADFYNVIDQHYYSRVMYFVYQPSGMNNNSAGYPCIAFSNNGLNWFAPKVRVTLFDPAKPPPPILRCGDNSNLDTVKLESVSGIRSQNTIFLAGPEGGGDIIVAHIRENRTLTYLFQTSPSSPHVLNKLGELPTSGLFAPTVPDKGNVDLAARNIDISYDPASDKVLLVRATPYPFLIEQTADDPKIPCSGVCPLGIPTFPMRGQIYSQRLNGNPLGLLTGTWKLETDIGGPTGWKERLTTKFCRRYPANDPRQTNIGIDIDSLNIHKTGNGFVAREPDKTLTLYMGAFHDRQSICDNAVSAPATFLEGELRQMTLPSEIIFGEVGRVADLTHVPRTVFFRHAYSNPVVFAGPASTNGTQTALVRVTSVLPDRFTLFVHEAPGLDGAHVAENVSYLVLEAGRWQLENGAYLEVGKIATAAEVGGGTANTFNHLNFQPGFSSTPVVMSQVQTNNNPHWVMTRQRFASSAGVDLALQQDDASINHGVETIGWLALMPTSGPWSGRQLRAANTADIVTSNLSTLSWPAGGSPAHFLASLATFDGSDSGHLRYRSLSGTSVQVNVEEDMTVDNEVNHTNEVVSYVVILGQAGELSAVPLL